MPPRHPIRPWIISLLLYVRDAAYAFFNSNVTPKIKIPILVVQFFFCVFPSFPNNIQYSYGRPSGSFFFNDAHISRNTFHFYACGGDTSRNGSYRSLLRRNKDESGNHHFWVLQRRWKCNGGWVAVCEEEWKRTVIK